MSLKTNIRDGLANVMSGIGTGKDKATSGYYVDEYISDYELAAAYRHSWLARKIVDIPAEDATRKWRRWNADDSQADAIESVENRIDLKNRVRQAYVRARLYGVGYLYISTNRSPNKPLDSESETLNHVTVMDRGDLSVVEYERDTNSERFGQPAMYRVTNGTARIHPSRVVKFVERENIGGSLLQEDGGDSVLTAAWEAIRNADSTAANVASLVYEAKIDVYKIPELLQDCGTQEGEEGILNRISVANMGKSNHNALVLDKEEEYEQRNQNFGSLNEIMMSQYQLAAGAAHIPITRLVGQSAAGLNSAGDNEIREYYDEIQSTQNLKLSPAMRRLDELIINNALGTRPDNIDYEWRSLWQLDEQQQSEIAEKNANTIKALVESGVFPDEAIGDAAVEMLSQTGAMPGLQSAINRYFNS